MVIDPDLGQVLVTGQERVWYCGSFYGCGLKKVVL